VVRGIVKLWNDDEGWGVVSSPEAPGDVWAHFAHIEGLGYRSLAAGVAVDFEYISVPGGQDGYEYRTVKIIEVDA
jgi:cold shock protein